MADPLLTLHTWLSPAFPVGAFAYSHGLETAIAEGTVTDAASARDWIGAILRHGAGRNDAVLLAHALRGEDPKELDALARALCASRERLLETEKIGAAFAETVAGAWQGDGTPRAYPVALGIAARAKGLPEAETVSLYLLALVSNLVSACIRLVPLGQTEGQRIIAAFAPTIDAVSTQARAASLDDIGGCALAADIASMRHETQSVRLFRS